MKKILSVILSFCMAFSLFAITADCEGISLKFDDLSYGEAGERNLLDLYLPENTQGEVGLVLYIHGGSWVLGDKNGYKAQLENIRKSGYAAAALNYRYASLRTSLDDILDDVTAALTKIKAVAAENGIEINKAMLVGGSAGAHIALMYAYTRANESPISVVCVRGDSTPADLTLERFAVSTDTLLEISCVTGVTKKAFFINPDNVSKPAAQYYLKKYSPVSFASTAVPTILCHGGLDDGVPIAGAERMYQELLNAGVPAELVVYPNSNHGLEADPDCSVFADELTYQYFEKYLDNDGFTPAETEPENFGEAPRMHRNLFNMLRGTFQWIKLKRKISKLMQ